MTLFLCVFAGYVQVAKMIMDLKFVELTADVGFFFIKYSLSEL